MDATQTEGAVELARAASVETEPCDVCGGSTYELRCKVICRRCGFTRDCSDP